MKERNWEQKRIKMEKTPHCLVSRTFSGMVALLGTPGSAVLPIKYYLLKTNPPKIQFRCFLDFGLIRFVVFAGGASTIDTSILILSARTFIRYLASAVLWDRRKLDGLSNQCALY